MRMSSSVIIVVLWLERMYLAGPDSRTHPGSCETRATLMTTFEARIQRG